MHRCCLVPEKSNLVKNRGPALAGNVSSPAVLRCLHSRDLSCSRPALCFAAVQMTHLLVSISQLLLTKIPPYLFFLLLHFSSLSQFFSFFPPFFSTVAAVGSKGGGDVPWGWGHGPCSGWAPAVGRGCPGGTCEVRMGLGQGVKKAAGEDGAGPAVPRGSGWGGGCPGTTACRSWLRSEVKGVRQVAASGKKQPVPMARKDHSQPSLTVHHQYTAPGAPCFHQLHV